MHFKDIHYSITLTFAPIYIQSFFLNPLHTHYPVDTQLNLNKTLNQYYSQTHTVYLCGFSSPCPLITFENTQA